MIVRRFLRLLIMLIFLVPGIIVSAQNKRFIYVQSDNSQPFYIKLNDKLFSSTASGYVILPRLEDGKYLLNIGFPKNEFPEQRFQLSVDGQNEGFLLKELGNKWTLLNIESMTLIAASDAAVQPDVVAVPEGKLQDDPFSALLAEVVKDSSILKVNSRESEPSVKAATVAGDSRSIGVIENETPAPSASGAATGTAKDESHADPDTKQVSAESKEVRNETENPFVRILLVNEEGGQDMVYVNKVMKDTIRLFLPVTSLMSHSESQLLTESKNEPVIPDSDDLTITPTVIPAPQNDAKAADTTGRVFRETIVTTSESEPESVESRTVDKAKNKGALIIYNPDLTVDNKPVDERGNEARETKIAESTVNVNSDCKSIATEKDFLKLRKKMAGENEIFKMIEAARRSFKSRCYTTEQLRNLSFLFLDDDGKYQFFDAAYPYTSDSDRFYTLESQLKDSYYIKRFKAMIRK